MIDKKCYIMIFVLFLWEGGRGIGGKEFGIKNLVDGNDWKILLVISFK